MCLLPFLLLSLYGGSARLPYCIRGCKRIEYGADMRFISGYVFYHVCICFILFFHGDENRYYADTSFNVYLIKLNKNMDRTGYKWLLLVMTSGNGRGRAMVAAVDQQWPVIVIGQSFGSG